MSNKKKQNKEHDKINKKIDYKDLAEQNLVGWQKALADYQNLEKEMNKRLADMNDFVAAGFILELLPIFDNYQIAISHIPVAEQKESWAVGLEHILKMWEGFLSDKGIEKIKTVNTQFDTNLHEAVGQIIDESQEDQIIVEEKAAGYISKDRVIRPARVIINNLE